MASELTRVALIWPYLPAYNVAFCDKAHRALAEHGLMLRVLTGTSVASRGDERTAAWHRVLPEVRLSAQARAPKYRRVPAGRQGADLVIVEQAIKNIETYPLLAQQHLGGPSVAMWGHGRSYSTPQGPTAAAVKQFLTRRGQWFFAYTQAGADHVIAHGFPCTRVTVLNNTIDTDALAADLSRVSDDDVAAFQRHHGLTPGRTALFLGGVDRAKGIDFLLESAHHAAIQLPGFVLLIGGAGHYLPRVQAAQASGAPIRALGRLDGAEKALALRAAEVMAIPEWIGLVAVDSLVAGRPIVSTWHSSHSPEHEYLIPGATSIFIDHDPDMYARGLLDLLSTPDQLAAMQARCVEDSANYSLDHMVDAFLEGVLAWDGVRRAGL